MSELLYKHDHFYDIHVKYQSVNERFVHHHTGAVHGADVRLVCYTQTNLYWSIAFWNNPLSPSNSLGEAVGMRGEFKRH